ncbi:hypothetical protein [Halorientalis pallida]|uniref:Uncharacterized protein n=1 Tax=Halorientalis pallida TaxID=2479928 RepID=A0A498KZT2_9EURY|nr:hypothetical protein [Halorientalis pallida]RXK48706.1 hypothetical protein EAF64_13630 [Halorientalis pallida]
MAFLLVTAVTSPVAGAETSEPSPPVTIEQEFVGTDATSEHAVSVTVTIAPAERTGAINNTVVTIRATDDAFIALSSLSTSETTGGDQVITQRRSQPVTFDIEQLRPGETASISFRVYPKAVLPSGETLATVATETQFVQTRRVVSETTKIGPTVNASQASYTVKPPVSPLVSASAGAGFATLVTIGVTTLYWRRRRAALRGLLRSAKEQATSVSAQRWIDKALARLGGDGSPADRKLRTETADESTDDVPTLNFDE